MRRLWTMALLMALVLVGGGVQTPALAQEASKQDDPSSTLTIFTRYPAEVAEIGEGLLAQVIHPVQLPLVQDVLAQAHLELTLARLSPNTLYTEATLALLRPTVRAFGLVLPLQLQGAVLGAPLPLRQSLLLIWPQITGLIAATILLFALGYVLFQRQEIRA